MKLDSLIAIAVIVALIVAVKQKTRGLKFWSSFFISLIAVSGVLAIFWKMFGE